MELARIIREDDAQSRARERAGGICRLDALMRLFRTTRSLTVAALQAIARLASELYE